MNNNTKMKCPMGMPGGVIAALIGLAGGVYTAMQSEWIIFSLFLGLFMVATSVTRYILMSHQASDRLEKLEKQMAEKE
jgi:hypothetical protein